MSVFPFEDIDIKIKEKTKVKNYKNDFLDQFMNQEKIPEVTKQDKNCILFIKCYSIN
jgi:hypothetical protein